MKQPDKETLLSYKDWTSFFADFSADQIVDIVQDHPDFLRRELGDIYACYPIEYICEYCDLALLKKLHSYLDINALGYKGLGYIGDATDADKDRKFNFIKLMFEKGLDPPGYRLLSSSALLTNLLSTALGPYPDKGVVDPVHYHELIELLHGYHVPVDPGNYSARTPIQIVSCMNRPDLIQLLYDKGADLDVYGDDETALLYAVRFNAFAAVEKLITLGADVNKPNDITAVTPLGIVESHGYQEIAHLLRTHGAQKMDHE